MKPEATTTLPADTGPVDQWVGRPVPNRDNVALWGYSVVSHIWCAALWVQPGWFPASAMLVSILLAGLILYQDRITAAIALRAEP